MALSIVINRPIAWYNVATSKEGSSLDFDLNVDHGYFNNIYYVNQKQLLIKPIQLVLKSGHFTALLPLNEDYTFKYNRTPSNQFCRLVLNYDWAYFIILFFILFYFLSYFISSFISIYVFYFKANIFVNFIMFCFIQLCAR